MSVLVLAVRAQRRRATDTCPQAPGACAGPCLVAQMRLWVEGQGAAAGAGLRLPGWHTLKPAGTRCAVYAGSAPSLRPLAGPRLPGLYAFRVNQNRILCAYMFE